MQRSVFVTSAGAALLASTGASVARPVVRASAFIDPENGQWGASVNVHELDGIQAALEPQALHGTVLQVADPAPSGSQAVTLANLPAVMAQGVPGHFGSPGSCEADSFGYCLGAYTAARNPDGSRKWSAADPSNAPSSAWLYQWEHVVVESGKRACPAGSGATPYANHLVRFGAPSVAQYPYNPHDGTTPKAVCSYITSLQVATDAPDQSRLLVGSYKGFSNIKNGKSKYLESFKQLIRNGHAIAFTGLVAKQYGILSPPLTSGAFTAPAGFISGSGHGQVIVGYDDHAGPGGAFLVQNSFGPGWNPGSGRGHNGRIFWDYDAFFASQAYALIMYPNTSAAISGTVLSASASGAPKLAVVSAHIAQASGGQSQIVLVTHASDGLMMQHVGVTAPKGFSTGQKLSAMMRFGYQYVNRPSGTWKSGAYKVVYTALDRSNQKITYRGTVQVS